MRCICLCLVAFFLNPIASLGQRGFSFEAGAQAGIPSDRPLERNATGPLGSFSSFQADNANYQVGPSLVFMVKQRFGGEVGFHYKPFDIHSGFVVGFVAGQLAESETFTRAKSWETAVLFRYAFTDAAIRPFATGGLSFQQMSGDSETRVVISSTGEEISRSTSSGSIHIDGTNVGLVMGGGAEWRIQRLRVVPEFRYIRRSNSSIQNGSVFIPSNQFEFLVGLRYRIF
ncbi:MAG TPA: hypothetical protein VFO86_16635 [Terriglobia bacterium]|nr:hypothetical protein [Terriglobia bacterium]